MIHDTSLAATTLENQTSLDSAFPMSSLDKAISEVARAHLARMFRDPYVLDGNERAELIRELDEAVAVLPTMAGLRVLLGMALCVNLEVQEGLEELRQAVRLEPDNFIARLKLGELLMRLRACSEAAEHTHAAARLACTPMQAELARRQAATIRTMEREGVERGGYNKLKPVIERAKSLFAHTSSSASAARVIAR